MKNPLVLTLLVLSAAQTMTGCVARTTVDISDRPNVRTELEAGDRILVTTTMAEQYELEVTTLSESDLSGKLANEDILTIPYQDLSNLELLEPQPVRTAFGLAGAFALSAAIIVEYPAYSLASMLLFRD